MAKVNLEKAIEEGRKHINPRYDMLASHMLKLSSKSEGAIISDAFAFGYYQGMKAAYAEIKHKTA